jgi:hypothetical protein
VVSEKELYERDLLVPSCGTCRHHDGPTSVRRSRRAYPSPSWPVDWPTSSPGPGTAASDTSLERMIMANVFFDVQGTLLTMEEIPRPRAREAFLMIKEEGHDLYVWSSGGAGYAATAADLLGVSDLVSGCFSKRQEPDVPVDFAVDDDASVVEAHGGYLIKPFDGVPADEELLRAAEALDAQGPESH